MYPWIDTGKQAYKGVYEYKEKMYVKDFVLLHLVGAHALWLLLKHDSRHQVSGNHPIDS